MMERSEATKIFRISLDEPLATLEVEERYRQVLLIVTLAGSVVGQVWLPRLSVIPPDLLGRLIASELGERVWRLGLQKTILGAGCGPEERGATQPTVSVVVCTRDRTEQLRSCLESLLRLKTQPKEILVVDNAPVGDETQRLCAEFPVGYVLEPLPGQSRARNRGIIDSNGELVAFTDDDCVVDECWLDGLERPFTDPLVMAATGYVAALEIETRSQWFFEAHGGFLKHYDRVVFDGVSRPPATSSNNVGAGANMIFRRTVFDEIGLFAEDLGPGTPARAADDGYQFYKLLAAGYRVEYDPARLVWHRHRRDEQSLSRVLFDYSCSSTACALRLLIKHHELTALRVITWWLRHCTRELWKALRNPDWLPVGTALAEAKGVAVAPFALIRSKLSRRRIPPLSLPEETGSRRTSVRIAVSSEAPRLSVVIPSRNRSKQLSELLDALALQNHPAERFEAIVVLDGSEDDSGEMVRQFPAPFDLRLLEQERVGAATSRNRGTRAATESHVVFIDDDIVPEANFLTVHARAHQQARDDHLALGRCPPVVAGGGWWGQALQTWWEDHYRFKAERGHRWTFADFDGGNASFRKQLFLDAGGFDEDFRGRREEWELGTRLLERGVRFSYYPEAVAWHHLDTRLETHLRHQRQHGRDDVLLAQKHPQLKPCLQFASFHGELSEASEMLPRYGLPLARLWEATRLRRYWGRIVNRMVGNAYALGLLDELGSADGFSTFVASIWDESVEIVPFDLDSPGPLVVPTAGSVELATRFGSTSAFGSVIPSGPGEDWDWHVVAERVLGRVYESARQAEIFERLAHEDAQHEEPTDAGLTAREYTGEELTGGEAVHAL